MSEHDDTGGPTPSDEPTGTETGDTPTGNRESRVDKALEEARPYFDKAADKIDDLSEKAQPQIDKAGESAKVYLEKASEQLSELSEKAQPFLAKLAGQAAEFAGKAQEKLHEYAEATESAETPDDKFADAAENATGAVDDAVAKMDQLGNDAESRASDDSSDIEGSDESE